MKNMKNNLDEMQEAKLLQIEHNACWLAFWGLLAALVVQLFLFGMDSFRILAGEWIVFMVLAVYLSAACLKNGIWDRRLKADRRTNLLVSLVAAAAAALLFGGVALVRYHSAGGALAAALISLVLVFACCFAALSLTARSYKKTLARLESQGDEDAESD
jgi:cation transport ATPase